MRYTNLLLFWILICCKPDQLETRNLDNENSTKHVFNLTPSDLRKKLIDSADVFLFERKLKLYYKEGPSTPLDTPQFFSPPSNHDDFYLAQRLDAKSKSFIYFMNDRPLDYRVSFHVSLRAIGTNKTEVEVIPVKPRVITGKEDDRRGVHFSRLPKYMSVSGSTIEEHEILVTMARIFGDSTVPATRYPM